MTVLPECNTTHMVLSESMRNVEAYSIKMNHGENVCLNCNNRASCAVVQYKIVS